MMISIEWQFFLVKVQTWLMDDGWEGEGVVASWTHTSMAARLQKENCM